MELGETGFRPLGICMYGSRTTPKEDYGLGLASTPLFLQSFVCFLSRYSLSSWTYIVGEGNVKQKTGVSFLGSTPSFVVLKQRKATILGSTLKNKTQPPVRTFCWPTVTDLLSQELRVSTTSDERDELLTRLLGVAWGPGPGAGAGFG